MAAAAPAKRRSTRTRAKSSATRAPATRAAQNARALANAQAAHAAAAPATQPVRRKSGPAAPRTQPGTVQVRRVAQARGAQVLDSLLRGRGWVALVAVLLAGIVFLNVSVLELNRGIARTDAQSSTLERTNSGLRAQVAKLDSAERIQRLAAARGFVLPQPGQLAYIKPGRSDARLAAERIAPPSATTPTPTPTPTPTTLSSVAHP